MKPARAVLTLFVFAINLSSCLITDSARIMPIEIRKPGVFVLPEELKTVAIINTADELTDNIPLQYFDGERVVPDTIDKYRELKNTCGDALAGFLKEEGYFGNVINYRDSLPNLFPEDKSFLNQEDLFQKTKSDICIFLDIFNLSVLEIKDLRNLVIVHAALGWTVAFKADTLSYIYHQTDTLIYEPTDFSVLLNGSKRINRLVNNSAEYLGRAFGSKVIPTWLPVERLYYKSRNQNMLSAERYALNNQWLKAAEIWNKQTKNKNLNIAAKACYNMALACEMEGKPDVAIDWLVRSYEKLKENSNEHKANCQRYISVLALRKKEIDKLGKQVRN